MPEVHFAATLPLMSRFFARIVVVSLVAAAVPVAYGQTSKDSTALKERVVLLHPVGSSTQRSLDIVEETLAEEIAELDFEVTSEPISAFEEKPPPPEDGNQLRAVAEMSAAVWAVQPVLDGGEGRLRLTLRVGCAPEGTMREGSIALRAPDDREPMHALLEHLLAGGPKPTSALTQETKGIPAPESDSQHDQSLAETETAETETSQAKPRRYGEARSLHLQIRGGLSGLVLHSDRSSGGVFGEAGARIGYAVAAHPQLELRAGIDGLFGATSGVSFLVGGAYFFGPLNSVPIYFGFDAELGVFKATTGSKNAAFIVQGSPLVAARLADKITLELAALEVRYLSLGPGAMSLGASARLGVRF